MPGFDFRYRLGGDQPTIRSLPFKPTERLTGGDMVSYEDGLVWLAATGAASLLGCVLETRARDDGSPYTRVITDADAVYAVEDPHARREGDGLEVSGGTGAQGVSTSPAPAFTVVIDSTVDQETLVRIAEGRHREIGDREGARRLIGGDLNAAIARAVIRFHREETGRGPNKARAFYRDDVVIVVLEDVMTPLERRLVARGRTEPVEELRRAIQASMREELVPLIEELTGAKVRAVMSTNHLDPDIAVEAFVLDQPVAPDPDG
jgi:uncharacterized protein YbcI